MTFDANKQTLFGTDQYTSDVPECMIKIGLVAPEHEQRLHDFFYDVIDGKPSSTQEARLYDDDFRSVRPAGKSFWRTGRHHALSKRGPCGTPARYKPYARTANTVGSA